MLCMQQQTNKLAISKCFIKRRWRSQVMAGCVWYHVGCNRRVEANLKWKKKEKEMKFLLQNKVSFDQYIHNDFNEE